MSPITLTLHSGKERISLVIQTFLLSDQLERTKIQTKCTPVIIVIQTQQLKSTQFFNCVDLSCFVWITTTGIQLVHKYVHTRFYKAWLHSFTVVLKHCCFIYLYTVRLAKTDLTGPDTVRHRQKKYKKSK